MNNDLLEKDLETLLMEKANGHKAKAQYFEIQAQFHSQQYHLMLEKIALLNGGNSNAYTQKNLELSFEDQLTGDLSHTTEHTALKETDYNFTVTYWKPRVLDALKSSEFPILTEDVLKIIAPQFVDDKNLRRKAIGVISSCLYYYVTKNKVRKIPNEGRGNQYEFIRVND